MSEQMRDRLLDTLNYFHRGSAEWTQDDADEFVQALARNYLALVALPEPEGNPLETPRDWLLFYLSTLPVELVRDVFASSQESKP